MAERFWPPHEVVCQTYPHRGVSQKGHGNTFPAFTQQWTWCQGSCDQLTLTFDLFCETVTQTLRSRLSGNFLRPIVLLGAAYLDTYIHMDHTWSNQTVKCKMQRVWLHLTCIDCKTAFPSPLRNVTKERTATRSSHDQCWLYTTHPRPVQYGSWLGRPIWCYTWLLFQILHKCLVLITCSMNEWTGHVAASVCLPFLKHARKTTSTIFS